MVKLFKGNKGNWRTTTTTKNNNSEVSYPMEHGTQMDRYWILHVHHRHEQSRSRLTGNHSLTHVWLTNRQTNRKQTSIVNWLIHSSTRLSRFLSRAFSLSLSLLPVFFHIHTDLASAFCYGESGESGIATAQRLFQKIFKPWPLARLCNGRPRVFCVACSGRLPVCSGLWLSLYSLILSSVFIFVYHVVFPVA